MMKFGLPSFAGILSILSCALTVGFMVCAVRAQTEGHGGEVSPEIVKGPETTEVQLGLFAALPIVNVITAEGPKKGAYQLICSGTLIGPRTLLTAAHCFYGAGRTRINPNAKAWLYVGDSNKSKDNLVALECDAPAHYVPPQSETPDFALCRLAKSPANMSPEWITLNTNTLITPERQTMHLMGLGCTESVGRGKALFDKDIVLRTVPAVIVETRMPYQGGGQFIMIENRSYLRVLCEGDSGGAALISISRRGEPVHTTSWQDANPVLVGVNSSLFVVGSSERISLIASTVTPDFRFFLDDWLRRYPQENICVFDAPDTADRKLCRPLK